MLAGIILYIAGKVTKIKALETIGFYAIIIGIVIWGLSFAGINIPVPF